MVIAVPSFEPFQLIDQLIDETNQLRFDSYSNQSYREIRTEANTKDSMLPLPKPNKEEKIGLYNVLQNRTATRDYNGAAIALEDLGTILSASKQEDEMNWFRNINEGIDITLSVMAWRVQGLDCPCFYDYCAANHSLYPTGTIPEQNNAENWFLQREFMYAPVIVIVNGTMSCSLEQYGSHGYRHLLVRGGAAAHNAWLAALTLGLSGTIFAGALPRPLKENTPIDGIRRSQLCAFSFGKPIT
ncbi:nitroreductase family protein [Bacillus velezensis]|uniref:nitroreductase family protein n=1 Tax=Bacillus velezensis TaxID=492670 RepID=UPI001C2C3657|nr:nitroreductase family protein [Bacillus velezensis]